MLINVIIIIIIIIMVETCLFPAWIGFGRVCRGQGPAK